jgi:tRNA(adenine34) deaminase
MTLSDDAAMQIALEEARRAPGHGDVPIGAVLLLDGGVLAQAHNERELTGDPTAHAEVLALRRGARRLGSWRLGDATLVVTLEPCAMCAGALVHARVARVLFATPDPKAGALGSLYHLGSDPRLNHEFVVDQGVRAQESAELLRSFFRERRRATPVADAP